MELKGQVRRGASTGEVPLQPQLQQSSGKASTPLRVKLLQLSHRAQSGPFVLPAAGNTLTWPRAL